MEKEPRDGLATYNHELVEETWLYYVNSILDFQKLKLTSTSQHLKLVDTVTWISVFVDIPMLCYICTRVYRIILWGSCMHVRSTEPVEAFVS